MTEPVDSQGNVRSAPRSAATRVLSWGVAVIAAALLALLLLRVFIRPIPPEQAAPEGHVGEPCGLCHFVTESADEVEVE